VHAEEIRQASITSGQRVRLQLLQFFVMFAKMLFYMHGLKDDNIWVTKTYFFARIGHIEWKGYSFARRMFSFSDTEILSNKNFVSTLNDIK